MNRPSPFNEAKPRTPKSEARQREVKAMKAMEELLNLDAEDEFKRILAEEFGIVSGHRRYEKVMATWRELQRGKL